MPRKQVFGFKNDTRHLAFRFLTSPLFLSHLFSFAGNFLGLISVGKVFGKVLTVVGFDVRKCMWVVEQDFHGIFWVI